MYAAALTRRNFCQFRPARVNRQELPKRAVSNSTFIEHYAPVAIPGGTAIFLHAAQCRAALPQQ
jgi:hypothetical protein